MQRPTDAGDYGRAAQNYLQVDEAPKYAMKAPIPETRMQFPAYRFFEYPKAALKKATNDDIDHYLDRHENFDDRVNKMRYTKKPPEIGSLVPQTDPATWVRYSKDHPKAGQLNPATGTPVIFLNPDEENAFYEMYPEIDRIDPAKSSAKPVEMDDKEYEDFQAWRAAKAQGVQQAGLFATIAEERGALEKRAEAIGLKIEKRWNHDTLRTAVIAAENKANEAKPKG